MQCADITPAAVVVAAFREAWELATHDYSLRRINAEHTLQSAIYFHLRTLLPGTYVVYTEAVIRLAESSGLETRKTKVVIDILICKETEIIAAVELKYGPRGLPTVLSMKKDIFSLSCITNRRNLKDRVSIEMPRFRSAEADTLRLTIGRPRELILAVYFDGRDDSVLTPERIWSSLHPDIGYWAKSTETPKHLGIALAMANQAGEATTRYFGLPFEIKQN